MLKTIQDFFVAKIGDDTEKHSEHGLQLATTALLFEMIWADYQDDDPAERETLDKVLKDTFSLSLDETSELAKLAEQDARQSVSLHQFTSLINQGFSLEEKIRVVELLWQVAFADGRLDRYEEGLVRKISELIYVPHRDFLQAKHRVQEAN